MRSSKRPFVRKYREKAVVGTRVCGTCCVAATLGYVCQSLRLLSLLRNRKNRGKGKRQRRWRRRRRHSGRSNERCTALGDSRENDVREGDENKFCGTDPLPVPLAHCVSFFFFFLFASDRRIFHCAFTRKSSR